MANQADATLIFDTEIDSKGFTKDSDEIKKAVKSLSSKIEGLGSTFQKALAGNTSAIKNFNATSAALEKTIENIEKRMAEMANEKYPTVEYTHAQQEIAKTEQALVELEKKQNELIKSDGQYELSQEYLDLQEKISLADKELQRLQDRLKNKIEFEPKVDSSEFLDVEREINQLDEKLVQLKTKEVILEVNKNDSGAEWEKLQEDIRLTEQRISELTEKETELEQAGKRYVVNPAIAETEQAIVKQKNAIQELLLKQQDMQQSGTMETETAAWQNITQEITSAKNELDQLNVKKQELENSGKGFISGSETQTYHELSNELGKAKSNLEDMNKQLPRSNKFATGLKSVFGKIVSVIGSGLKKGIGSFVSKLKGAGKSASDLHKKILKMGLALIGMRGIMGGIKQIVSSALSNNEELQNQLTAIKGVLGQAFTPIINALISGLSKIVTLADKIFSIFSGVSLIAKYNAAQTSKMASGTSSAAKSAKDLKRQLAGFDELNVLSDSSSDSSGSSDSDISTFDTASLSQGMQDLIDKIKELYEAGDFYGIGAVLADGLNNFVSKALALDWDGLRNKVNTTMKNIADVFNGFVENVNWNNVGKLVGEAVQTVGEAIGTLATSIHYDAIGEAFAEFWNGLMYQVDWQKLANYITDFVDKVISGIDTFFVGYDWKKAGNIIGTFVNSIINIDWANVGKTLGDGVKGIIELLSSTIAKIDWEKLGKDVVGFIMGIDWVGILGDLGELIGNAFIGLFDLVTGFLVALDWSDIVHTIISSIVNFFAKIDWGKFASSLSKMAGALVGRFVKTIVEMVEFYFVEIPNAIKEFFGKIGDYFDGYVDWSDTPANIIQGLFDGIVDALKKIGTWIKEHIFEPFMDGFKSAFGIHSPSTKMKEMGGYLIDGLKNGIGDVWKKIKEKFTALFTSVKDWFKEKADKFKEFGSNVIEKVKTGIGNIWNTIKEKFTAFWSSISTWFSGKWESIKNFGVNIVSKIKTGIANIWSSLKEKFTAFWTNLSSWFSGKWESIKNFGSTMISKVKTGIGNVWSSIKEKFTTFWTNLSSWFSGKAESLKSLGGNIIAGIKNGINNKISEIKTALTDGLSSALTAVKKLLGIHSPSRVFRDEVGQFIGLGVGEGITGSIQEVVKDTATLAGAILDELNSNEYAIEPISTDGANVISAGMDSFAEIITDGFTNLIDKLQAIANGVTFTVPAAVNLVPYKNSGGGDDKLSKLFELSNDELIHALIQMFDNQTEKIVKVIEALDLNVTVDSKKQVSDIIAEIKRITRVTGSNPLLG